MSLWPPLLQGCLTSVEVAVPSLEVLRASQLTAWPPSPFQTLLSDAEAAPSLSQTESSCQCRRRGFNPQSRNIPWRRKWQPTLVFLLGQFQGPKSLVVYSPWVHKESSTTEQLNNNNNISTLEPAALPSYKETSLTSHLCSGSTSSEKVPSASG